MKFNVTLTTIFILFLYSLSMKCPSDKFSIDQCQEPMNCVTKTNNFYIFLGSYAPSENSNTPNDYDNTVYKNSWQLFHIDKYNSGMDVSKGFFSEVANYYKKIYKIPTWSTENKKFCKQECEALYKKFENTNLYDDWDCDYLNQDLKNIFKLDSIEYYNCYLHSRIIPLMSDVYELGVNKDVDRNFFSNKVILHETKRSRIYSYKAIYPNFIYKFVSSIYCNWFCGLIGKFCSSVIHMENKRKYFYC